MGLSKASQHDEAIVLRCEDSVQFYNWSCAFHQLGRQVTPSCYDTCHRATMNRFSSDLFFCFLGQQAASIVARWKPSCYDDQHIFFTFWAFSCLFASWTWAPFGPAYFPLFFFSLKIVKKEKIVFDLIFFYFLLLYFISLILLRRNSVKYNFILLYFV